jgi:hypothetical protein
MLIRKSSILVVLNQAKIIIIMVNKKKRPVGAGIPSQQISVFDQDTQLTTTYNSMAEATRALDLPRSSITDYFKQNQVKPYKDRYIFTKVG